MTERRSDERRPSDEDEPRVDKETVKDLEPSGTDDVKGGERPTATENDTTCTS